MAIQLRLNGSLQITGLSTGSNTIPHGLPVAPQMVKLRPSLPDMLMYEQDENQFWTETQPSDGTNFYLTVKSGAPTAGIIDFWCPPITL